MEVMEEDREKPKITQWVFSKPKITQKTLIVKVIVRVIMIVIVKVIVRVIIYHLTLINHYQLKMLKHLRHPTMTQRWF